MQRPDHHMEILPPQTLWGRTSANDAFMAGLSTTHLIVEPIAELASESTVSPHFISGGCCTAGAEKW